ncbi:hypothetical protein U5817_10020 [Aromatoleum evansii]|uniref:Bacteriophage tail tape measure C-terminal domain-containing protein n=1 Tax=Aromatoleum evansii TaxID=59406 RepID=A0ABZ1AR73_AROEV|nr:hypothetical protein U5817_09670 [Aromatoleum evansii]WRL48363.1 hypothetical protein U5817_10020 [Aromatoleum evansii]
MALATLTIDINARLANIERDMGKAAQIAQRNADKMAKAFAGVGTALAGLGGVAVASQFAVWVKGAVDAADRLDELSERTGVAVETLNGLDYAMKLSGGSSEELEKGLQNLNKRLSEVAAGDKSSTALFRSLGIGAKSAEEALLQLADVFPRLSKADQVRVGNDLLGKSYAALVPLLAQGRAGLQGMIEEGQRLNPITAEMAKQSAEFNDNLDRLQTLANGAATQIGNGLIPQINELLRVTLEANREIGNLPSTLNAQINASMGVGDGANIRERIADVDRMIAKTDEWEKRFPGGLIGMMVGVRGSSLRDLRDVLAAQERIQAQAGISADNADRLDRLAQGGTRTQIKLPPIGSTGTPKAAKALKAEDVLGDFLKDVEAAVKPAEDAIARFRDIQLDAATAGAELTKSERAFLEIANSPEWERMPESYRDLVRAEFDAANGAERLAKKQADLNDLLESPSLKRQRADMLLLAEAYEKGRFGLVGSEAAMKKYGDTVNDVLGNVATKTDEATGVMDEFAKQAARNMQDAFADFLFDPFSKGIEGMLDGFARVVRRMIAEALAAELAQKLFGSLVSGGQGGGLLGAGLSFLTGLGGGAPVSERSFTPVPSALGNAFAGKDLEPFAKGGAFGNGEVLDRPTYFRFASGGAWRNGVAGEAGPEAALPLKRMANGKLGVYMEGQSGRQRGQQPTVIRPVISPEMANMTMREWVEGWLARELAGG